MLKKIRTALAGIVFILFMLMFMDFSGLATKWFGWLAKIQFLPAVLALNAGIVILLLLVTVLFGRVYCSVICPLGIFQDVIARFFKGWRKKHKKNYTWSPEKKWLRYGMLAVFIVAIVLGVNALAALLAPYSSFGRIAQNLFSPVWIWGNNLCAWIAEKCGGYAFAHKEVWIKSLPTFIIASVTFVVIFILAARNGRTYCNTICPVGTVLSFFSRFAIFRPVFNASMCKSCHLCERNCKASCIDVANKKIDYSRCVACFDCLDNCKFGGIKYRPFWKALTAKDEEAKVNANEAKVNAASLNSSGNGRRAFIGTSALALGALTVKAQEKKVDGGLAAVIGKKVPERQVPVVPFGALSVKEFYQHCTACQLCVSQCPNDVLRPSMSLEHLMQPEMSFERGWCRVECNKCSEVCPSGPIKHYSIEEKTTMHIGTAHVDLDLCIVNRDGVSCGNCARHCPAGAIMMVRKDPSDKDSLRIPTVNENKCLGCGACEFLCPSRPFSAIRVNGLNVHRRD